MSTRIDCQRLPSRFSAADERRIGALYENAEAESVIFLGAKNDGLGTLSVKAHFKIDDSSIYFADYNSVRFSLRWAIAAMNYCYEHKLLCCVVHNHAVGSSPSLSDIRTFTILTEQARNLGLGNPTFAIYDMQRGESRIIDQWAWDTKNYPSGEEVSLHGSRGR